MLLSRGVAVFDRYVCVDCIHASMQAGRRAAQRSVQSIEPIVGVCYPWMCVFFLIGLLGVCVCVCIPTQPMWLRPTDRQTDRQKCVG